MYKCTVSVVAETHNANTFPGNRVPTQDDSYTFSDLFFSDVPSPQTSYLSARSITHHHQISESDPAMNHNNKDMAFVWP